jgi:hypothetical protein
MSHNTYSTLSTRLGRDDVSFFVIATSEKYHVFSSFVNCVVLATLFAAEQSISKDSYTEMPLMHLFGLEYQWMLRDAISANGNYEEIYASNFGLNSSSDRGRNTLNAPDPSYQPQLLELPGLRNVG